MAKKKKKQEKNAKKFSEAMGFSNIFSNEKIDFILGLLTLLAAGYVIIAMVSYFSTGQADQSLLQESRVGEWLNEGRQFTNYCGSFGAIIAYTLMDMNFGLPAFLIPFFFVLVALKLMHAYEVKLLKWFFGLAVLMEWCAVTFAKFLSPIFGFLTFNPGGKHGQYIVEQAENLIGPPGLTAILLAVAIIFLTILSAKTISAIRIALNPTKAIKDKVKTTITTGPEEPVVTTDDQLVTKPAIESFVDTTPNDNANTENTNTFTITDDIQEVTPINMPIPEVTSVGKEEESKLTVEAAGAEDQATSKTVEAKIDLSTPINPKEPFTRYKYPTLDLLKKYESSSNPMVDMEEVKANNARIIEVLNSFGVKIREIKATVGPTITLYEVTPAEGVKISKIRSLEDDIALCLSALGVRIIAPIPGKGTVGIEVPNKKPQIVSMESLLNSKKFQETTMELPLAIGKTITNEVFMVDLAKLPHLLVAGATGQGKSVGLNAIITSLLYKKHPNELKIVLVDPKKVEFTPYSPIADHFMAATDENVDEPIITDVTKVVRTLNSLCVLMDHRYDLLKMAGAKNIKEYNEKFVNHKLLLTAGHEYMPYVVVIIDEFGDLIMTAGKEVELPIARIAQLARAVGIHMIIATQRPTTSIITGNIKANFPGRMAFRVGAMIDSRTILDRPGANQLVGRGDLLFLNGGEPVRVQCAFVDTPEIERINEYISKQCGPTEPMELPEPASPDGSGTAGGGGGAITDLDPYFEEAAHAIVISQQGSTSMIQRRFSIGYNRAGRLMDQLEEAGIVGPAMGSKPRDVLITDENSLNNLLLKIKGVQ